MASEPSGPAPPLPSLEDPLRILVGVACLPGAAVARILSATLRTDRRGANVELHRAIALPKRR